MLFGMGTYTSAITSCTRNVVWLHEITYSIGTTIAITLVPQRPGKNKMFLSKGFNDIKISAVYFACGAVILLLAYVLNKILFIGWWKYV